MKKVIIAGIPNQFWQIHPVLDDIKSKSGFKIDYNKIGSGILEEFNKQKDAIKWARKKGYTIVKIESHRD